MKSPARPLLIPVLTLLLATQVRAGLAEATDFDGTWTSGTEFGARDGNFWLETSTTSLDGVDAAEGVLYLQGGTFAYTAWMQTTVVGPTTLYFSYKVVGLGTSNWGGGSFSVGDEGQPSEYLVVFPARTAQEDVEWTDHAVVVPTGPQNVRFRLGQSSGSSAARAYVDQVWTSDDARPRITETKFNGQLGTPFSWEVPVASSTAATLSATGLPRGFTIDGTTHVISGTPTEAGTFEARLTARNASGQHIARVLFEVPPGTTTIPEALDAPGFIYTQTAPEIGWRGVTGQGVDGVDSALALATYWSVIPANNLSINSLSTTVHGPGILSFWFRCEARGGGSTDYSLIRFYLGVPPTSPQGFQAYTGTSWTKATVPIPAGAQTISWSAVANDDFTDAKRYVYLDKVAFVPADAPQLALEVLPEHTNVPAGGTQSFGDVFATSSASLTFSIKNTGLTDLTGLATTIDGVNAADFTVTTSPVAPIAGPNGGTSFTVQFSPSGPGAKSAILHITSNDPDDTRFDINLAGTGLDPVNGAVAQGTPVSFSVNAAGVSSVQWRKDGVDIPGAVGPTLTIPSAQPWHIGVYTATLTTGGSSTIKTVGLLGLTGVPSAVWGGLVACYPFDAGPQDLCRPGKPATFVSTTGLVEDPQRGGVAHVVGKGWAIPPLPGEPVELQGPGGYLQLPRPPLVTGEPFTVSFVIKEEGFSFRHGESLFTMGEETASIDLLAHFWIGGLDGYPEVYSGPSQAIEFYDSDYVPDGLGVSLNSPWTAFTAVADGNLLRLYRNGQLMGSSPYNQITSGDSFIGRHWWENGGRFSTRLIAKVDDVRIYNRALSEQEVQQLYALAQTTPPAGSFGSWVLIHGLIGADAGLAADPDHDGLGNWEEFCFGTSPTDGTQSPMKAGFAGATLTLEWLEIEGVTYSLKESPDLLAPWADSPSVPTASGNQTGVPTGYHRVQVIITMPQAGAASGGRFLRVEATKVP